jgi:hypothetical protein
VKIIALLAVMAMLLLSVAMPNSSVGGPLTIMLILFLVMLAVGIHEAWLKKRGVLGGDRETKRSSMRVRKPKSIGRRSSGRLTQLRRPHDKILR